MVKVREDFPLTEQGEVDIARWLDQVDQLSPLTDRKAMQEATELARQIDERVAHDGTQWMPGASLFLTGLEMVNILAELHLDTEALIAAVLYRAVRENHLPLATVERRFGNGVAHLIEGVRRMAAISSLRYGAPRPLGDHDDEHVDNIRRMLVGMIDDVRIALIKLAERTCAIRDVKDADPERRLKVAREVFDIYAPLAHRLGIGHLKWELEDLSFRYINPDAYKQIANELDEKRLDRQRYIENAIQTLTNRLKEQGIEAEITGRAKHIYSIWRKMKRKGVDFSKIYDVRALRVLVDTVAECYTALGVVHSIWRYIPQEFDDYIANPKPNGYQSLHTAVIGPEGKVLEVQIRTHAMHEEAELGVCAHWLYKGTDTQTKSQAYEAKLAWLRQVLEEDATDEPRSEELLEQIRETVQPDRIYVFTPDGEVLDLPAEATPLDFAYKVHTDVGHACRGARVNGRIVPLTYKLKTGDQVEIITGNEPRPSRDWLNPDLGYITSPRARAKIVHWFRLQDREANIQEGREILREAFRRMSVDASRLDAVLPDLGYKTVEDVYAAVGTGDLKPMHVARLVQKQTEPEDEQLSLQLHERTRPPAQDSVVIHGVGNLLTNMAQCCKPVPGDPIVGYITQGRGVSIHRQDCINALQLQAREPDRIIEVEWGQGTRDQYPIDLLVEAYDRAGLLRDVTTLLANERVNVTDLVTHTSRTDNTARIRLTVEVNSLEQVGRLIERIRQLPNVADVRRIRQGGPS
ncbi:MAG: GTP diphosphokinase [Gammaproteobacteria bacterium]|nr:MAG: GTP diphosphokinase [Gammaproteobacteria bacterium]